MQSESKGRVLQGGGGVGGWDWDLPPHPPSPEGPILYVKLLVTGYRPQRTPEATSGSLDLSTDRPACGLCFKAVVNSVAGQYGLI